MLKNITGTAFLGLLHFFFGLLQLNLVLNLDSPSYWVFCVNIFDFTRVLEPNPFLRWFLQFWARGRVSELQISQGHGWCVLAGPHSFSVPDLLDFVSYLIIIHWVFSRVPWGIRIVKSRWVLGFRLNKARLELMSLIFWHARVAQYVLGWWARF